MWSKWSKSSRACLVLLACAAPIAACNELISVGQDNAPGDGDSFNPRVSADGRFVVFDSAASNLVANDTNGNFDVFVRDRSSGSTERVSVKNDGTQAVGGSGFSQISEDGRLVVFSSNSPDLVPPGIFGVLVRDRVLGTTRFLGEGRRPAISADGRWVAALQNAAFVRIPGTSAPIPIGTPVLFDVQSGAMERPPLGMTAADLALSADGRVLGLTQYGFSGDIVISNGVINGGASPVSAAVRVLDRARAAVEDVAVGGVGSFSQRPSLSADGRIVAFDSLDGNLVSGDTNGFFDAFVRDRATGETVRISVSEAGEQGNGGSGFSSISADGDRVVYASFASSLVPGDTNGLLDTFVHVRSRALTRRISIADDGTPGNGASQSAAISADGSVAVYVSSATNLSGFTDAGTAFDIIAKPVVEVLPALP